MNAQQLALRGARKKREALKLEEDANLVVQGTLRLIIGMVNEGGGDGKPSTSSTKPPPDKNVPPVLAHSNPIAFPPTHVQYAVVHAAPQELYTKV